MARIGERSPQAERIKSAREKLVSSIAAFEPTLPADKLSDFISALQHYIDAAISYNSNPRF